MAAEELEIGSWTEGIEQLEIPENARAALNEVSAEIESLTGNGFGVLHPADDLSDLVDNLRAMVAEMRNSP